MRWTDEQERVIKLRKRNLLVSAAAGSGKTAVLVERIVNRITDGNAPIDLDRIVVVTFTKAAAAEMRERVGRTLEERASQNPDDVRLQKQVSLLPHAQISTIDSFCTKIVKTYFHTIGLDPGFRMGEDGELKLLEADVMARVLEELYAKCAEEGEEAKAFVHFVESYATGKGDEKLEDMVRSLYYKSMSNPWPEEWLLNCKRAFCLETPEQMEGSEWMASLLASVRKGLSSIREWNKEASRLCELPDAPEGYRKAVADDERILDALFDAKGYEGLYEEFQRVAFMRATNRNKTELSERIKGYREKAKKGMQKMRERFFFQEPSRMLEDVNASKDAVLTLIDLSLTFLKRYREAKEEKGLLDFHDLEHFALKILTKREGEGLGYTPVAGELMRHYEEIMVDEYQDSNLVQETILQAISGERDGKPNRFMVGDVKQSIYRFRLARPELFMDKFRTFRLTDGVNQRIDLQRNFRSRAVVLEGVNLLFRHIMKRDLGGVEYDDEAALYPGASFGEASLRTADKVDVLLVTKAEADEKDEKVEGEARVIGERILELTGAKGGLYLQGADGYRLAEYRDVVVLLRTVDGWADRFVETFLSMGIPAYSETKKGYFTTLEVQTVLNALKIMDNPRQDVPMAAVLRSPMGGFSNEELAVVCSSFRIPWEESFLGGGLYDALTHYALEGGDGALKGKVGRFLAWLEAYRQAVPDAKAYELIQRIYEDTGYYHQVMAMPDGERRAGNLDMLVQKALEFDASSYKGLFQFNRYVEKLEKYEVEYGEASVAAGRENAVRVMTIHKSKGLEFPVVFVSGLGKKFNLMDVRNAFAIHPDLGVGNQYVDYERRTKTPTILQRAIQNRMREDSLGEELRVLYVAMTRAKEQLILTGFVDDVDKSLDKWSLGCGGYLGLMGSENYLGWVMPALLDGGREEGEISVKSPYACRIIELPDKEEAESVKRQGRREKKEALLHWDVEKEYDGELSGEMARRRQYRYPHEGDLSLPVLVSVSELKRRSMEEGEACAKFVRREEPTPRFRESGVKKKGVTMAKVGSAYHAVLQHLRFGEAGDEMGLKREMERLVRERRVKEEEREWVSDADVLAFLESDLGRRMQGAERRGGLYKEMPFVIGMPANEVDAAYVSKEMVLVQGIVDAYFEEGEDLALVDYKTDEVGEEGELAKRYGLQLGLYRNALERITGKRVREAMIYSFALGKTIHL